MLEPRELTMAGILLRIATAVILGGMIGRERGMKNRPAGLRTYMLVCLGACVVMIINQYAFQVYNTGDPVRLGAQVVSGIGFLGAGTIIVTSHNQIKGLTTAAGLWAAACIGLAVGIGLYEAALTAGLAVYVVLTVLHTWDYRMRNQTRIVDLYVELNKTFTLGSFIRRARELDLELSNIQREEEILGEKSLSCFIVTVQGKHKMGSEEILRRLREMEEVSFAEVL